MLASADAQQYRGVKRIMSRLDMVPKHRQDRQDSGRKP